VCLLTVGECLRYSLSYNCMSRSRGLHSLFERSIFESRGRLSWLEFILGFSQSILARGKWLFCIKYIKINGDTILCCIVICVHAKYQNVLKIFVTESAVGKLWTSQSKCWDKLEHVTHKKWTHMTVQQQIWFWRFITTAWRTSEEEATLVLLNVRQYSLLK
jgi:hypothetical protein